MVEQLNDPFAYLNDLPTNTEGIDSFRYLNTLSEEEEDKNSIVEDPFEYLNELDENQIESVVEDDDIVLDEIRQNVTTYDAMKENQGLREAALRFSNNYLGDKDVTEDEAVDEVIEHLRMFDVNELVAAGDMNYVTNLKLKGKEEELNDYRMLYTAFRSLPRFYQEGNAPNAINDYFEGIVKAPSTWVGLLLPAGGKIAGQTAIQTAKLAMNKLLMTAGVEAVGGALQDVAAQKTEIAADLKEEYSPSQTALAATISAVLPTAAVVYGVKKGAVTYIERNTGDIVEEGVQKLKEKQAKAEKEIAKTLGDEKNTELVSVLRKSFEDKTKKKQLDPELVKKGETKLDEIADETSLDDVFRPAIRPEKYKNVLAGATELLAREGGLKAGERVSEGLARVVRSLQDTKAIDADEVFNGILDKYNLHPDDLANIWLADVSNAARTLAQYSKSSKELRQFGKSLDNVADYSLFNFDTIARKKIRKLNEEAREGNIRNFLRAEKEVSGEAKVSFARNIDRFRVSIMTTQPATTVRNTISGTARIGIDTLVRALDRGIARATGNKIEDANEWYGDIFGLFYGLINKKEAMAIQNVFQREFADKANPLFRALADFDKISGDKSNKLTRLEGLGRNLNILNTMSDNFFKRIAFSANMKKELNVMYTNSLRFYDKLATQKTISLDDDFFDFFPMLRKQLKGKKNITGNTFKQIVKRPEASSFNLVNIIKNGDFKGVFSTKRGREAMDKVVQDTMYFTYQRPPDNKILKSMIQIAQSVPFVTTSFMPFPRFIANALRFTYEYSPAYILFNKEARGGLADLAKMPFGIKNEDVLIKSYEEAGKGLVGTALVMGAVAFRMSEHAGDRWYEGQTSDGKLYDLRPMFPAAPYLFIGDIIARLLKGEPVAENKALAKDAIQALSGTQFRTGIPLYSLEKAIEDFDSEVPETKWRFLVRGIAEMLSTFTIPLSPIQDVYNTFFAPAQERIARKTDGDDLFSLGINTIMRRVPANYTMELKLEELLGEYGYRAPEELRVATKKGEIKRVTPISRQMTGLLYGEKRNEFEKELERLKIRGSQVYQNTGVGEYDNMMKEIYGTMSDEFLIPYVLENETYNSLKTDKEKRGHLIEVIKEFKKEFNKAVNVAEEKYKSKYNIPKGTWEEEGVEKGKNNPRTIRKFKILPKYYREQAIQAYINTYGKPKFGKDYNYEVLLEVAKQLKDEGVLDN